jgi:excisionase family DNA binding protein
MSLADQLEQRTTSLTVGELSHLLNCSEKMTYKLVSRGNIPHFRVGTLLRFDPLLIANWWRERSIAPRRKS